MLLLVGVSVMTIRLQQLAHLHLDDAMMMAVAMLAVVGLLVVVDASVPSSANAVGERWQQLHCKDLRSPSDPYGAVPTHSGE